jgi:TPR repeat protein
MSALGRMHLRGEGAPKDLSLALKWIRKAAECGDPAGMHNLGVMHELGLGVGKDPGLACEWKEKARKAKALEATRPRTKFSEYIKMAMFEHLGMK